MHRLEIIANASVREELEEALELAVPGFAYTVIPQAQGRGERDRKLGTSTWPELNFILIAYLSDDDYPAARKAVTSVRERFPREGIAQFDVPAME